MQYKWSELKFVLTLFNTRFLGVMWQLHNMSDKQILTFNYFTANFSTTIQRWVNYQMQHCLRLEIVYND
jgi:hypothetical protein